MKRIITLILTFTLSFALSACGGATKELTSTAEYEECDLALSDGVRATTDEGKDVLIVYATYTNNNSDPLYAYCSFNVAAFQNDVEITDVSDINGDEAALIQEVKNGQELIVRYVFELTDDSPVEVIVRTPTADTETIGRQVYLEQTEE